MFTQVIDPLDNLTLTCLVALIPVVSLLVMLAVFRVPAWLATLVGSLITFALAAWVWKMPLDDGGHAYLLGAATGVWNGDWITLMGTGRSDHRSRRRDRLSAARVVGLGRHRGRGAGAAATVGALVPGVRLAGSEGRLAARGGRLARLYRGPVSGRRTPRSVPAGCQRRDRVLHRAAHSAQGLAAEVGPRLWRRTGRCGNRPADAGTRTEVRRGAAGLAPLRGAAGCRGGLDRTLVAPAEGELVQGDGGRLLLARRQLPGQG